ncbi:unnamed protein product [Litomosoides sigmodontis]|uniref:Uncharacterized protein n=1 Tax=Litomosoides sigmodontis TaxID=42156 RepID=A0A3P6UE23_LITSI|nr:unnamed protein product [Litomosoides sigmodontis]
MAVFKKLKHKKDKQSVLPLPDSEPVKQLDDRVGLCTYRDFFTLKNYWKAVDRKKMQSAAIMFQRFGSSHRDNFN